MPSKADRTLPTPTINVLHQDMNQVRGVEARIANTGNAVKPLDALVTFPPVAAWVRCCHTPGNDGICGIERH